MTKDRTTKALFALNEAERYRHFVQCAASCQKVWGLFRDGWALSRGDKGQTVFPLWPSAELAKACAQGAWLEFEPEEIPVDDLLDQLLPQLAQDKVSAGIFPLPGKAAPVPSLAQLIFDLENALGREDSD